MFHTTGYQPPYMWKKARNITEHAGGYTYVSSHIAVTLESYTHYTSLNVKRV